MSKIKNGGFDQYGAEPFEHQQFESAGVEGVKLPVIFVAGYKGVNNSFNYCFVFSLYSAYGFLLPADFIASIIFDI